jgi:hypothetical protein
MPLQRDRKDHLEKNMQKIPLQLAKPDMVLAKPVTRENGMVLIAAGTVLTAGLITKLDNMGVELLVVEGETQEMGGGCSEEVLAKKRERLDHLFRKFADDKYMQQVKQVISDYYVRQCALAAAAQAAREEGK